MTGFLASVTVLLPLADPDLSFPLPDGADLRIAHPSRTHGPGCRAAVFSRDGTKLATVSDRTVLVREWPGGRRLMEIHFPRITSGAGVAFSPDGLMVAAWETSFSSVTVGDLRTGEDRRLEVVSGTILYHFSISHATFVSNGLLRAFGERLDHRLTPTGKFEAVDFDPARETPVARRELPGSPRAIATDASAAVLKTGEELRRFDLTVQRFVGKGVKFESDLITADAAASRITGTTLGGEVVVHSTFTGKLLMTAKLPDDFRHPSRDDEWVAHLHLSPDGAELTAVHRRTVRRWRVEDGTELPAPTRLAGVWLRVADGPYPADLTAIDTRNGHLHQFNRATAKPISLPTQPLEFAASQNGKWLADYDGNTLVTRDAVNGWVVRRENRPGQPASYMTVSDDGKQLHVDPKRSRVDIPGTDRWVESVANQLRVHQSRDGGAVTSVVAAVSLPPKDGYEWGEVLSLTSADVGRTLAVARPTNVDLFDSDLRHLRRIQVIPIRDRVQQQIWSDITEHVTGAALSSDGRRVAIGKYVAVRGMPLGTEFFIHEVATGEQVTHIDYLYGSRTPLGFTPNGRHLWTAGDGVALRYDLKPPLMPVFDRRNVLAELRGENAALADLAAGRLASPGMLKWLGEQLPPDRQPDAKRVAELIGRLADRDFRVREAATAGLIDLGPGVAQALREVQKAAASPEAKRRAVLVLNRLGGDASPDVLLRVRAVIAVAMLAEDGNPDARKLLDGWAKGVPGSPLTDDARAALARLPK